MQKAPPIRPRLALIAIAAAAAVPILLFALVLMFQTVAREREAVEDALWRASRDALTEIDKLVARHAAALLAVSSFLEESPGDFGALYTRAAALLRQHYAWHSIRLVDAASGAVLIEVAGPGGPPAPAPAREEVQRVARTGRASAVMQTGAAPAVLSPVVVRVPVWRDGKVAYVLAAGLDPAPFSEILLRSRIPPDWTAAAIDSNFVIAGRSRAREQFLGTPVTPSLRAEIERATENYFYSLNKEGERVYTLFTRSPLSGWTVAIGAPAAVIERPLFWSGVSVIGAGGAAVVIAGVLAVVLVRNFERRQAAEQRLMALAAETEAERRLSEIARNLPGMIYRRVLHPDGRISYPFMSDGVARLIGRPAEDFRAPMDFAELARRFVPDDRAEWEAEARRSARELTPYQVEGSFTRKGEVRWLRSLALPHRRADGAVVWDGVALDVTEEKQREQLLREQAEVLDTLQGINAEIAGELDLDRVVRIVAEAAARLSGAEFAALFYRRRDPDRPTRLAFEMAGPLRAAFADMPVPRDTEIFRPSFVGGQVIRLDDVTQDPRYGANPPYHGVPPGHPPVRSYLSVPVISRSGKVAGGLFLGHGTPGMFSERSERILQGIATQAAIALDNARLYQAAQQEIRERRRAEEQQSLLMAELDHRVRNILAVVQSLALSTLPRGAALDAFRGRLGALAHAHGLLAATQWQGADLGRLAEAELAPYAQTGDGGRLALDGEAVMLRPSAAQTLVLAIHELTTNAVKYGALSAPGGHVGIAWRTFQEDGKPWLRIDWTEAGGPPAAPPSRSGFGHSLIARGVAYGLSGRTEFAFPPDGFRCRIEFPQEQAVARP